MCDGDGDGDGDNGGDSGGVDCVVSVYLHNVQLSYTTVRKELKSREALWYSA